MEFRRARAIIAHLLVCTSGRAAWLLLLGKADDTKNKCINKQAPSNKRREGSRSCDTRVVCVLIKELHKRAITQQKCLLMYTVLVILFAICLNEDMLLHVFQLKRMFFFVLIDCDI